MHPLEWQNSGNDGDNGNGNEFDTESDVAVMDDAPDVERPKKYAVILHNDDYTTMEFVIKVLVKFFGRSQEQARQIMLKIHHEGQGVAGVYSFEIAETKVMQVNDCAKASGFPLKCTMEPVDHDEGA